LDKNVRVDEERAKTPFPIFRDGKGDVSRVPQPTEKPVDKPTEKPVDKPMEMPKEKTVQPIEKKPETAERENTTKQEQRMERGPRRVSAENRARLRLNVTMTEEQILAIVRQQKAEAESVMVQEEQDWRERVAIADGEKPTQPSAKAVLNTQNEGVGIQSAKQ
jgi:hypothetical protein